MRDRAGCNLSDFGIFTRAQRVRFVPKLIELSDDPNLPPQMRNWVFIALQEITGQSRLFLFLSSHKWSEGNADQ